MTIGLKVHGIVTELGPGGLLHSFCSTVAVNLEKGIWGSRFPILQKNLYEGRVPADLASGLRKEVNVVREELRGLPSELAVWDISNRSEEPPWGTKVGAHVTDLSVYYVTNSQRNLLDVIAENAQFLEEVGGDLEVVSYRL